MQKQSDNFSSPKGITGLFKFNDSKIYDWDRREFVGIGNLKEKPLAGWLKETYQYYRYDVKNSELLYGVTAKVLDRYLDAIVAIEPGNELNWQPPGVRSSNPAERAYTQEAAVVYFQHFCAYAKARGKYCIMPSMADGVVWQDPSGQPDAYTMLSRFTEAAKEADFANLHLYFEGKNASYGAFFGFIDSTISRYRPIVGDKRYIITEFGYSPKTVLSRDNDQLISRMRAYVYANPHVIAGSSYWFDVGHAWQSTDDGYRVSATMIPFDTDTETCPSEAYCPLVRPCTVASRQCSDVASTGGAWAYRQNDRIASQFK
jgi:hypothetical protein